MFKQFAIARFMVGFIVFLLAYMVASLSYDVFFHFLTAAMFFLTLWIMHEVQAGHREELAAKDRSAEEKLLEMQELLDQREADIEFLHEELLNAQRRNESEHP